MPVMRIEKAPEFSWENLKTGDTLGRVEGKVSPSAVQAHAFAIGDDPDRYILSGSRGIVPPTLLSNDLLKMFFLGYQFRNGIGVGLHTRAQIDYMRPVEIGEPIVLTGSHVAKYVKAGRRYRCQDCVVARPDGTALARMLATETVGYQTHDEEDTGEIPADWSATLPRIPAHPPEGKKVFGVEKRAVSYEQSIMFSGLPFSWARDEPLPVRLGTHTSAAAAADAGFAKPIVQGLLTSSHLTRMMIDEYGDRAMYGSQYAFTFINPLLIDEELTMFGMRGGSRAADGEETVQLSASNSQGKPVAVGNARISA